MTPAGTFTSRRFWLACVLLFLAALAVRALPWSRTFHDGKVFFYGTDSWYQVRRVEFAMRNGLRLPEPDPYLNYPQGGRTHLGPLFGKSTALAAMLLGVDVRDRHALETFCAWVPAVLGALCAVVALALGWLLFGAGAGLLCGGLMAVLPAHVCYSMLGHFDHHVAESLLFGAVALALLLWRRAEAGRRLRPALAAGACLWLLSLVSPSITALYTAIFWLICLAEAFGGGGNAWLVFALPAFLLIPAGASSLGAGGQVERLSSVPSWLMFEQYSFFQPLLLAFCAASVELAAALGSRRRGEELEGRALGRLVGSALACGLLAAALAWPVWQGAASVLFKGETWVRYIAEYRPLFFSRPDGVFSTRFAFHTCGYLLAVFPLLWLWAAGRTRSVFFRVAPPVLFVLVLVQLHSLYVFAYGLALTLAAAWARLREERPDWVKPAAGVLALCLWPCGGWLWSLGQGSPYRYLTLSDQDYEMLSALERSSPSTSGYYDVKAVPEYGVLCPWSMGHAVIYLAKRPAVADPFGHGIAKEARYYTATDAAQAVAVLEENKARYAVAQDPTAGALPMIYGQYLKLPPDHPLLRGATGGLFQTRLLSGAPQSGPKSSWRFDAVFKSPEGRSLLFEFSERGGPAALAAAAPPSPVLAEPAALQAQPRTPPRAAVAAAKPAVAAAPARPVPAPLPPTPVIAAAAPAAPAAAAPAPSNSSGRVAAIGEKNAVTEQDLVDFTNTENCYGPDALSSRKAGFMRMLENSVMDEVLRREANISISEEDYAKELKRVDEGTRAPDILACIKKYFGWNPGSGWTDVSGRKRYERIFLRKNIVPGPFHKFVSFDRRVQGEAYGKRDAILERARRGEAFARLAEAYSVEYATRTYTMTDPKGQSQEPMGGPMRWSPFEAQFIEEHLKALKSGQMKAEPIDAGDIMFVKLVSVEANEKYYFETIRIPKKSIPEYLRGITKLNCRINDPQLLEWVRGINGNPMLGACAF
ncbi:MAG: STT3 domain-containing protein [Elusimicrobia bacterium]|nr:STT3 domain-containing protein [Elusimicrobiota bacterium]